MHTKNKTSHAKIFFFGKCLFAYKIRFAFEKKQKKILGQAFKMTTEKFLCRIWKLYGKHFFSKKFKSVFFCHHSVQLFSKSRRNG